jgi:serine/threonine protein kinase/Flp pilus assembly protein TadD
MVPGIQDANGPEGRAGEPNAQAAGLSVASGDSWCASLKGNADDAFLFHDLNCSASSAAQSPPEEVFSFPEVGGEFLGFRLIAELGRGSFGRVYLGRQGDLADRPVALKVSTEIVAESQKLARLQHTNIVPVYSLHRSGPLQAVCMPYFGSTTLADVMQNLSRSQRIPASGKDLVSTIREQKSRTRLAVDRSTRANVCRPSALLGPEAEELAPEGQSVVQTLKTLEGWTYVESILWIGAKLADGLAHAHERGILHRDLKPANVLLTDDGEPMLLDFNLSEDVQAASTAASIGGTLPYMSPEHLEAFQGKPRDVDARSDVYSLGLILFELLTGRSAFDRPPSTADNAMQRMVEARQQGAPAVRTLNPSVTPAVEAIIRKCLDLEPKRRYQSARDLHEDLERQRAHRPLRHAPDRNLRERLTKWARRNPRLASSTTVAIAASVLLAVLAFALVVHSRRLDRFETLDRLSTFQEDLATARLCLTGHTGDPAKLEEGRAASRSALARYSVLDRNDWCDEPAFRKLPEAERQRVSEEAGELLLLLARETSRARLADAASAEEALKLNLRAEECYPTGRAPRALWLQRAELTKQLGRDEESKQLLAVAADTPVRGARDHYLLAREQMARGRYLDAIEELQTAVKGDPQNFPAWYMLGICSLEGSDARASRAADAVAHFNTCIALRPNFYGAYQNRGRANFLLRRFDRAEADFSRVIEMRPDWPEGYVQRALARQARERYWEALDDFDRAVKLDPTSSRTHFLRARVRVLVGDKEGADRDHEEGLRLTPADEENWIIRGIYREPGNPRGALDDFAKAVEVNPRSLIGLANQAYILAERLHRTKDAVALLDHLLELYPDYMPGYGDRGIYLARLGKRAEALEDAQEALRRDHSGETLFQVAGIYALTSRTEPDDRFIALQLLTEALRKGYGFDLLVTDHDLDPLRNEPEFRELVRATQPLRDLSRKNR